MRFRAVLNRDGGTFSSMDLTAFAGRLEQRMEEAGHSVDVKEVAGKQLTATLEEACHDQSADGVVAGGGDGTISFAAGLLAGSGKVLGLLPAGTMNLFARSLGIPIDPDAAIEALADADVRQVDIATANGRPFVHQFSIGLHPQFIHLRSRMSFKSRTGKLAASGRAALATLMNPHNLKVALRMRGTELITVTPSISVTNNLYGEGHLPFTDEPDGGVLGVYVTQARRPLDLLSHVANMALGRWQENEQVEIHEAKEVHLKILSPLRRHKCAIDGELCPLEKEVHIRLRPKALRVLAPRQS